MINIFHYYLKLGKAKKKTPDSEEAKALLEKAKNRIEYTKSKEISSKNAQFVLEDSYESIRESAQALMSVKGFKPYSHEAAISFVKEFKPKAVAIIDKSKVDQLLNSSPCRVYPWTEGLNISSILLKRLYLA